MTYQNELKRTNILAAFGCTCALLVAAASAASAQPIKYRLAVPEGKTVPVVIERSLSSNHSWEGEKFTAVVNNPGGQPRNFYHNSFPEGTHVHGHVTAAIPRHGSRTGFLSIAYDYAVLPNGSHVPLRAVAAGEDSHSYKVESDGRIVGTSKAKSNAEKSAGIGAAAGAVGDLLLNHGKVNLGHVLAGGAAGYGVSTIDKAQKDAQDVTLETGTKLGMKLVDPVYLGGRRG